jgi:hypothetical protein
VIAQLRVGDLITVRYGYEIVNGIAWVEVQDKEGRLGWIPEIYTLVVTLTPTPTHTGTPVSALTAAPAATSPSP